MGLEINLSNKTALVTAASRGIGFGIAEALAISGAKIIITARNPDNLKNAVNKLTDLYGADVTWFKADNAKTEELSNLVRYIEDEYEGVDIFVFNTGGPKPGRFFELDIEDWRRAVDILLYPAIYLTQRLIGKMIRNQWGRIIYSMSIAIKEPIMGLVLSNTVRISLAGLIRTLSREFGPKGITVNGIMPGYILTDRIREIATKRAADKGVNVDKVIQEMTTDIPAGRMGEPREIGYLAAFLASDYASYINGAIIPVDGGLLHSSL